MRVNWHAAILRTARWLVPAPLRAGWLREWEAELWYVRRAGAPAGRFSMGAFRDAFMLRRLTWGATPRLESPVECLLVLAILASVCLLFALRWPVHREEFLPPSEIDSGLVVISTHQRPAKPTPTVSVAQYEVWAAHMPAQFTALAFTERPLALPEMRRIITHPQAPQLPPDSRGFVVARMRARPAEFGHIVLPGANGGIAGFDYRALAPGLRNPFGALLLTTVAAWLVLRVTRWPGAATLRPLPWIFLTAKLLLVLPIVVFGALDLGYLAGARLEGFLMLTGWVAAIRWVLDDQRRRCPVCLRLLINPVGIGQASQTFLGWYGTELMCARGHGMLHVPEIPTSSSSSSRWVRLDPSWTSLF